MGKAVMFFGFVFLVTCIAGSVLVGYTVVASAELTADITSSTTTIPVDSTTGFAEPGIIVIDGERIAYSEKTSTTFAGTLARPIIRGTNDTDAAAHLEGAQVRMLETSLINSAIDYNLAIISDSAGAQAFLSVPTAVFNVLLAFGRSPFKFLGTDLQIITLIWGVAFLGLIVSFFVMVAGGRRV